MDERRSTLLRAARVVWLVGLGLVLIWLIWTRRGDLARLVAGTSPVWLLAALALGVGQLLPSVLFWSTTLHELGEPRPLAAVASVTARSVPARYLPGSVWYALGRAGLLRREQQVSKRALAVVAALESSLGVVVAIALGTALLAIAGRLPGRGGFLAVWFVLLAVVGSPPVVNAALSWVAERRGGTPVALSWSAWARLVAVTSLHWAWSATTFAVYLHAFPGMRTVALVEVAGSFLIGWVVGFLAVFAPQGLGVFEAAVAAMLVGEVATVAVVIGGYRALMLVRDGLVFGVATVLGRRA